MLTLTYIFVFFLLKTQLVFSGFLHWLPRYSFFLVLFPPVLLISLLSFFHTTFHIVFSIIPPLAVFPSHVKYSWLNLVTSLASALICNLWFLKSIMISLLNLTLLYIFIWLGHSQFKSKGSQIILSHTSIHFPQRLFFLSSSSYRVHWDTIAGNLEFSVDLRDAPALVFQSMPSHHWSKYHICWNSSCSSSLGAGSESSLITWSPLASRSLLCYSTLFTVLL